MKIFSRSAVQLCLASFLVTPVYAAEYEANIFFDPEATLVKYGYTEFAERVAEATDGDISFKVYTSGVLLPARASMEGLRDGVAQVGYHAGTYTPDKIPLNNIIAELSFINTDNLITALATTEMSFVNPEMEAEWKANGVVFGGGYSTAPYVLFCNKEVASLDQIEGKRIRTSGAIWDRWATTMGAVSVNVPTTEVYSGLERGTLDCAVNPAEGLRSLSFWDVSTHVLEIPLGVYYAGFHWGYNAKFWSDLSVEQRKVLYENMAWAIAKTAAEFTTQTEIVISEAKDKGLAFVEPSEGLADAHAQFLEEDKADLVELAETKYAVPDANDYIDEYLRLVEKWDSLLAGVDRSDIEAVQTLIMDEIYNKVDVESYGL